MEKSTRIIKVKRYVSPVADMLIGIYNGKVCFCDWARPDGGGNPAVASRLRRHLGADMEWGHDPLHDMVETQFDEYFAGRRKEFDFPYMLVGTEFQLMVWRSLADLAWGEQISYSELATRLGKPKAVRAVANAVGANPISIAVPCHRIVGVDGSLTGYAGGLAVKSRLLAIESEER